MLFESDYNAAIRELSTVLDKLNDPDVAPGFQTQLPIGRTLAGGPIFSSLDELMRHFAAVLSRRINPENTSPDNSWMKHLPSERILTALKKMPTAQLGNHMNVCIPSPEDYFPESIPNARTFPPRPGPANFIPSVVTIPFQGRLKGMELEIYYALYESHPNGDPSRHIEIASLVDDGAARQAYTGTVYGSNNRAIAANQYALTHVVSGGAWGQNS